MSAGQKIIKALEEATRGDFARVTVAGQTWVKLNSINTMEDCVRAIVRDELHRSGVVKDVSDDI